MNKSITTLKAATLRNQAKTNENIKDRMNENKKLIKQLDRTREEKRSLEKKYKDTELEIQTLKLKKNKQINN